MSFNITLIVHDRLMFKKAKLSSNTVGFVIEKANLYIEQSQSYDNALKSE